MDLYGKLVSSVLHPLWENRIRRRPTLSILSDLERSQWLSPEELEIRQLSELRALVAHAHANVPHYRDEMKRAGVHPSQLRTLRDFWAFPVLTRDGAQASGDARKSVAPPLPVIVKRTSGTSGRPLTFAYDPASEHWRNAVKMRGYGWAGHRVGAKTLHYWGFHPPPKPPTAFDKARIKVDRFLKRERYENCLARGDGDLARVVEVIRRYRPEVIVGYSLGVADLARYVVEKGVRDWDDIPVLCAAEKVFPRDRELLEKAFGRCIFETYGSREVMLMASECESHDGLHIQMENILLEVAVREGSSWRAARPGEVGEVLVTDLHNYGMPFLRYANGDLAIGGQGERCSCGRGLARIFGIDGRVSETLRDAAGGRVAGMSFAVWMAHLGQAVKQFQAVQHRDGALTFRYVPGPGFDDSTRQYLRTQLEASLKGYPVRLEPVGEIPVSASGKRKVVIVEGDGAGAA
jgi:phenylacetate-CoA ligase